MLERIGAVERAIQVAAAPLYGPGCETHSALIRPVARLEQLSYYRICCKGFKLLR